MGTDPLKAVQATPKPMDNDGTKAASTQEAAVKSDETLLGHNAFRPDIYKITEGYLS